MYIFHLGSMNSGHGTYVTNFETNVQLTRDGFCNAFMLLLVYIKS